MDSLAKTWKQSKKFMRKKLKIFGLNKSEPSDWMPILVLYEIIGFLSLPERLKCKRISKQWKMAVETAEGPHSLCIYRIEFPYNLKWCFSKRNVISEDIVYSGPDKFCNLNSRIELFKDLRKLSFFNVEMSEFFKDLQLLSKLKVLMIDGYYIYSENRRDDKNLQITLHSNGLEKLSFKRDKKVGGDPDIKSIEFNTPKLNSIIFWNDGFRFSTRDRFPVRFRYPLIIKHLECIEFDSNMSVLSNLETLVCQKITCPFKLADFKSLQRLELFPNEESELNEIREIVNEKWNLQRENLEIIVCGFKDLLVACKPEFPSESTIFELNDHYVRQVVKHSDNFVGPIPWKFHLTNFPSFYRSFRELPSDFFPKFANIFMVCVSKSKRTCPPDPSDVLQLLRQTNPKWVDIGFGANTKKILNFSKGFYEQLTSIQSINTLYIQEWFENLDFDLFLRLKYLKTLYIGTEKLPIDFIRKFFKLKYANSFLFSYSNISISVYDNWENYTLFKALTKKGSRYFENMTNFDYLKDLIEDLKRLKTENPPYLRGCLL